MTLVVQLSSQMFKIYLNNCEPSYESNATPTKPGIPRINVNVEVLILLETFYIPTIMLRHVFCSHAEEYGVATITKPGRCESIDIHDQSEMLQVLS